jgi:hypothetical protein
VSYPAADAFTGHVYAWACTYGRNHNRARVQPGDERRLAVDDVGQGALDQRGVDRLSRTGAGQETGVTR